MFLKITELKFNVLPICGAAVLNFTPKHVPAMVSGTESNVVSFLAATNRKNDCATHTLVEN